MKLLSDFPTIGEPHYAQGIPAELVTKNQIKIYKIEDKYNPYATKSPNDAKVERKQCCSCISCTMRSHFTPDNIEGVKQGIQYIST